MQAINTTKKIIEYTIRASIVGILILLGVTGYTYTASAEDDSCLAPGSSVPPTIFDCLPGCEPDRSGSGGEIVGCRPIPNDDAADETPTETPTPIDSDAGDTDLPIEESPPPEDTGVPDGGEEDTAPESDDTEEGEEGASEEDESSSREECLVSPDGEVCPSGCVYGTNSDGEGVCFVEETTEPSGGTGGTTGGSSGGGGTTGGTTGGGTGSPGSSVGGGSGATIRGAGNSELTALPTDAAVIELQNPLGSVTTFQQLIGNIIAAGLGLVGSLALLMFVVGAFEWLTAAGSSDKIQKGARTMTMAAVGLFVIFASYGILRTILSALTGAGS